MNRRFPSTVAAVAILLATAALSAGGAAATAATPREGGGGQRLKAALAQLDLSADQKQRIRQIFAAAARPKLIAAGASVTPRPHGGGRALMNKIMAVLTAPQQAKFRQLMHAGRTGPAAKP